MPIFLSDEEAEVFISQVETIHATMIALSGCIDEAGDVRDMVLRSGLTAADALLHVTEMWMYTEDVPDEDAPAGASKDVETCGHPITMPPFPNGQVMCESCGASHFGDGQWALQT